MKKYFIFLNMILGLLISTSIWAWEPSLEEVNEEVMNHLKYDPSEMNRWRKNSRWSAALPRVQVGVRRDIKDVVQLNTHDNISITSGDVFVGPTENSFDQDFNQGTQIDFRALWQLNELIFSRDSLAVSSEIREVIHEKNKILQEVNAAYHTRKRLVLELKHGEKNSNIREKKKRLLDQMNGILDAYTEGWFSRVLQKKRGSSWVHD